MFGKQWFSLAKNFLRKDLLADLTHFPVGDVTNRIVLTLVLIVMVTFSMTVAGSLIFDLEEGKSEAVRLYTLSLLQLQKKPTV